jgi:hypothetical protein
LSARWRPSQVTFGPRERAATAALSRGDLSQQAR